MQTRERLERTAKKLAAAQGGHVTLAQVARAAGVTWPTASRHLGGRAGLARLVHAPPRDTRRALLDGATEAIAAYGVEQTSLAELALAGGLTKGAVYWHFPSKEALVSAVIEHVALEGEPSAPVWVPLWAAARRDEALASTRQARRAALEAQLGPEAGAVAALLLDGLAVHTWLGDAPRLDGAALAAGLARLAGGSLDGARGSAPRAAASGTPGDPPRAPPPARPGRARSVRRARRHR